MGGTLSGKNKKHGGQDGGFGTPAKRISGTDSRNLSTLDQEDRKRSLEKLRVTVAEIWNECHLWSNYPTL